MAEKEAGIVWQDRKHHLWFPWSFTKYYIENDRLMVKRGFFNTVVEETLLYRIVDITFQQSLAGKIFGTGNLVIKAKVDTSPEVLLQNIKRPMEIRNLVSELVEGSRQNRNVVGKEFYGGGHQHADFDGDGACDFEEKQ